MHDALFKAAGDAARPFLVSNEKKMNLNITISTSPLGQQGMHLAKLHVMQKHTKSCTRL